VTRRHTFAHVTHTLQDTHYTHTHVPTGGGVPGHFPRTSLTFLIYFITYAIDICITYTHACFGFKYPVLRHVVQIEETRNEYGILLGKPETKPSLRDMRLDGRVKKEMYMK